MEKSNFASNHHENEAGAASINAVLLRCTQNGRTFFTAEDYRAARIIKAALGSLIPCDNSSRLSAPQTLSSMANVVAFGAVEGALFPSEPKEDIKHWAGKVSDTPPEPPAVDDGSRSLPRVQDDPDFPEIPGTKDYVSLKTIVKGA